MFIYPGFMDFRSLFLSLFTACLIGVIIGTFTGFFGFRPTGAWLALALQFWLGSWYRLNSCWRGFIMAPVWWFTTSILVNVPGESVSVLLVSMDIKCEKGPGGAALLVAAIGSWVAGTLGVLGMMLFALHWPEQLGLWATRVFCHCLIGHDSISNLTGGHSLNCLMVIMGLMIGTMASLP
jgi:putative tricarboxylic transport membrane protein